MSFEDLKNYSFLNSFATKVQQKEYNDSTPQPLVNTGFSPTVATESNKSATNLQQNTNKIATKLQQNCNRNQQFCNNFKNKKPTLRLSGKIAMKKKV
ncbi:hypothetical protein [Tenacibaculum aiptasiae]|uniref:hypothetical protein n=1 Tax=Tenacibaculum aiptasiae TaxID=426481 RepID=UPI00232B738D|nr:hypothetical protein [Tenacibaculum aiptasiae]